MPDGRPDVEEWGAVDGEVVHCITLRSSTGLVAKVITLGATLTELHVSDADGQGTTDVVLGFDSCDEYAGPSNPFFGCTVGRTAGRMNPPSFVLDGREHTLHGNDGGGGGIDPRTHVHGGKWGFSKHIWEVQRQDSSSVALFRRSPDGEEGYPGALEVVVEYSVHGNDLMIKYDATTTNATPVSLTNHTYFDLSGGRSASQTMLEHELQVCALLVTRRGTGSSPGNNPARCLFACTQHNTQHTP
jgi:aldose 1-epimerase